MTVFFRTIAPVALLACACSLSIAEQTPCTEDAQCIASFGGGSVCQASGVCSSSARCETSYECVSLNGFGSTCDPDTGECRDLTPEDIEPRCAKTEPSDLFEDLDAYRDRIVFLTAHDTTASSGHLGRESGVRAGIREINEAAIFRDRNGVGRQFGLVMCDELGHDPDNTDDYENDELGRSDAAVYVSRWGVDMLGVRGIIGPAGSSDSIRAYTEVVAPANGETVQIVNGAASPALTTIDAASHPNPTDDNPGWLWRSSSSGEGQGIVLANDLFNRVEINGNMLAPQDVRTVALIHETGAFGSGIADAFEQEYLRLTGRSAAEATPIRVSYADGDFDELRTQTDTVTEGLSGIDAVFFGGQVRDHTEFMTHISESGSLWLARADLPIYFPQTAVGPNVFREAENTDLFDQVIAADPSVAVNSSAYGIFRTAFISVDPLGRDPEGLSQTAQSWDAAWMMAAGAMWAGINEGAVTGTGIARGVRRLTPLMLPADPATDAITDVQFDTSSWAIMASVFGTGPSARVDARGATGELSYDLSVEEKPTEITILQSQETDGESPFVPIAQCSESLVCEPL